MNLDEYRAKNFVDRQSLENAYGNRKNGCKGDLYNYDLNELINDFSFYDFISKARGYNLTGEHGGFMVITDKQYIIGYNSDYGKGTHNSSYARCMADLEGGKKINSFEDSLYYSSKCQQNFITARFVYEKAGVRNGYPVYSGRIIFVFPKEPITKERKELFQKFYDNYATELRSVCERYNFTIEYLADGITSKNCKLEDVLKYVIYHEDIEAKPISSDDEVIIGTPLSSTRVL